MFSKGDRSGFSRAIVLKMHFTSVNTKKKFIELLQRYVMDN